MQERIIEHPLRDIVLMYDETKRETAAEKNWIKKYIEIHDLAYTVEHPCAKYIYELTCLEDEINKALKAFEPIAEKINLLQAETLVYTGRNDQELIKEISEKISAYHPSLLEFHNNIYTPANNHHKEIDEATDLVQDNNDKLYKLWKKFTNLKTTGSAKPGFVKFSLDCQSLNNDEVILRTSLTKYRILARASFKEGDLYDILNNKVKDTYNIWKDMNQHINDWYDVTGVMKSTLSDSYANGTGDETKKPIYLIPPGDKKIKDFKSNYGSLGHPDIITMNFSAKKEDVENGNPSFIEEQISCFQHYPKLIEKMLFSIDIEFQDDEGNEIPAESWKGHSIPIKWINKLYRLPCSVYFFRDHDVRSYILMGDMIIANKGTVVDEKTVSFEGKSIEELCQRIFHASWYLYIFCYNTGFDPQIYIESFLADFDLPVTYEMVKKEFEDSISQGMKFMAVPVTFDKDSNEGNINFKKDNDK